MSAVSTEWLFWVIFLAIITLISIAVAALNCLGTFKCFCLQKNTNRSMNVLAFMTALVFFVIYYVSFKKIRDEQESQYSEV